MLEKYEIEVNNIVILPIIAGDSTDASPWVKS